MATSRRRKPTISSEGVPTEVMEENAPVLDETFAPLWEVTEPAEEIVPVTEEKPVPVVETVTEPPAKVRKPLDLQKSVRTPRNVPRFSSVRKTT